VRFTLVLALPGLLLAACDKSPELTVTRPDPSRRMDPLISEYLNPLLAAAEKNARDALHRRRLAMAYEANELWDLATLEYRKVALLDPDPAPWLTREAVCLAWSGELAEARSRLEGVVKQHPGYAPAWHRVAIMLLEDGDLESATQAAEMARDLSPNTPAVLVTLAQCYGKDDRIEEAIALLEEVTANDPGYGHAAFVLGRLYQQSGRDSELYTPLVERGTGSLPRFIESPVDKQILRNRAGRAARIQQAVALGESGRAAESVQILMNVVKYHPEDYAALVNLGISQQGLRKFEQALKSLDRAIDIDPESYRAHMGKAKCLLSMRRFEDALSAAQVACDKGPGEWIAHFLRGQIAMALENWPEALDALTQANTILPEDGRIEVGLFEYYSRTNQPARASRALLAASRHTPDNPAIWVNLMNLYAEAGQLDKAREAIDRALALAPDHAKVLDAARALSELEARQR